MPSKWVPLEANPEVFNAWSEPLGLPSSLAFQDLYSLDPDFLQYTPLPVYAVLLLFPATGKLQEERKAEDGEAGNRWQDDTREDGDKVWWIKQTIGNACGSIGLLHALLNLPSHLLHPSSTLSAFKTQSLALDTAARAKLLETTDFFSAAHTQAAQAGQSSIPSTQEEIDTDLHFLALVQAKAEDGSTHIVELDGNRSGPLDRGPCTDFLTDAARVVQGKYIDRSGGDVRLNMVVLAAKAED